MTKKPIIRFKNYNEDWEQRKVKDIFRVTRGYVLAATKTVKDKSNLMPYPVYSSQTKDQGLMGYYNDYLYENAITWTTDGANAGTVNYREGKFYCTNVCGVLISEEGYANKMVSEALNQVAWKHVSKVGNPKLMNNVMSEVSITIPKNLEEQKEISTFINKIDNLITLHQRKLEALEKTKKSFLQKMFPKKDETKPEIRFAGFTDDWEQRKFEEVFEFPVSNNTLSRSQLNYEHGSIKNIHYGDILIKYGAILDVERDSIPYITNGNLEKYRSQLIKNGDLIFADAAEDNTVGKAIEVSGLATESLVAGLHTIVARSKSEIGTYFLGYYINSAVYHYQLLRLMQGAKVSSISKRSLRETKVCIPTGTEEQQKIGTFFKQLDDTIALHQRQLEALEKMKKSFLQKMFI
ncbi:restriction endonuclease subunit S (plasmid) [Vagococcus lutrae]|uniref:restriction endonuclease subunit S n=1 Tax=Vagococcus lutrae TaxID=81947 RepID=UPI00200C6F1C|nr:restriction endonuclease subunit S [Vagococcus lutrae]UQF19810.1 restriction endonuclease subunit S [Vagococcus lutrae]